MTYGPHECYMDHLRAQDLETLSNSGEAYAKCIDDDPDHPAVPHLRYCLACVTAEIARRVGALT